MHTIIIISILIGAIPAILVYSAWRRFVWIALILPSLIDAYMRLAATVSNAVVRMKMAIENYKVAIQQSKLNLKSGGFVSPNSDPYTPETIIKR